jgi:hypothetical protein
MSCPTRASRGQSDGPGTAATRHLALAHPSSRRETEAVRALSMAPPPFESPHAPASAPASPFTSANTWLTEPRETLTSPVTSEEPTTPAASYESLSTPATRAAPLRTPSPCPPPLQLERCSPDGAAGTAMVDSFSVGAGAGRRGALLDHPIARCSTDGGIARPSRRARFRLSVKTIRASSGRAHALILGADDPVIALHS